MDEPLTRDRAWKIFVDLADRASETLNGAEDLPDGLRAACAEILLREGTRTMAELSDSNRKARAEYILGFQEPKTGIFSDPSPAGFAVGPPELFGSRGLEDTHLALQALNSLGYPLHFSSNSEPFPALLELTVHRDPTEFARTGVQIACSLERLIDAVESGTDPAAAARYFQILQRLQADEDPETGFFKTPPGVSRSEAIRLSARLLPYWGYVRSPLNFLAKKIDTLLGRPLAESPAFFQVDAPAAAAVLSRLAGETSHRSEEVRDRLFRSWQILSRNPWREASPAHPPGTQQLDAWRSLTMLASMAAALWNDFPAAERWQFRRSFDPAGAAVHAPLTAEDRERLPLWYRGWRSEPGLAEIEKPILSVIVPCYNLGAYLPEAVDSVLAQTCSEYEIIIIDDGSTDEFTRLLLDVFLPPRTQILREPNRGVGAARNLAIRRARGRYICCLDPDDRIHPEYLDRCAAILDDKPEVGFVSAHYRVFGERLAVMTPAECGLPEALIENKAIVSSVFRKSAWEQAGGFFEHFSVAGFEDWDLWISLLEAGWTCEVIPEALFDYRIRPGSMYRTALQDPEKLRGMVKEFIERHPRSFQAGYAEIISGLRAQIADLVNWIAAQEVAQSWWQGQADSWKAETEARDAIIAELKTWNAQLLEENRRRSAAVGPVQRSAEDDPEHRAEPIDPAHQRLTEAQAQLPPAMADRRFPCDNRQTDPASDPPATESVPRLETDDSSDASAQAGAAVEIEEFDYTNIPGGPHRPGFGYQPEGLAEAAKVTLITPFFNTGSEFHETACSVLGQSFQSFEWLIINDGSNDPAALAILAEYRDHDPRVRVIDLPENRGLSAARNAGFRHARTPFVVQLDSDDLLEPTAVEKWYWFLQSYPEYAFVKGYTVGFGEQRYLWRLGFEAGRDFLKENQVDASAMIRREVHQAVGGYDETNRGGLEDWDFWLKCADRGYWGVTVPEFHDWYRRRATHADRWDNWSYSGGHSKFQTELRRRYPNLWRNGFPEIRPRWHMPNDTLPDDLPAENRLQKHRPRLLLIVPWLTFGGADKFNLDLVEQLRSRGWEISLATTARGDHSWLPHFEKHTPDVFVLSHFLRLQDYPRFLRYLIRSRRVDAVLISNSELGYLLLPYLRYHCPEAAFLDFCHMEEEGWKNGGYPRMAVEYQELLDFNLVSSEHLKRWMVGRGAAADRIRVCYTNIAAELWRKRDPLRRSVRRRLAVPEDLPLIVYAARISEQKQPEVFIRTILALHEQNAEFFAVAAGDGPKFQELEAFVKRHRLETRVLLLGSVSNRTVRDLMRAADIFFLPSQWEGIALSIYEAMAAGLAVVGARVGGQAELVTPECGTLIERGSQAEEIRRYTHALLALIQDPALRESQGRCAAERVRALFPIEKMGEVMIESLAEAVRLHREAPRPLPGPGLARACAAEAIEYMRLFQLADQLWTENNRRQAVSAGWSQRDQPDLRTRIYLKLYQWHEPYYRRYSSLGWTWLDPIRSAVKKLLLK